MTFEYVLDKNPDYLFVVDRSAAIGDGGEEASDVLDNALIHQTNAYKNNTIFYLDSELWYLASGGLYSTLAMIEEVSGFLEGN